MRCRHQKKCKITFIRKNMEKNSLKMTAFLRKSSKKNIELVTTEFDCKIAGRTYLLDNFLFSSLLVNKSKLVLSYWFSQWHVERSYWSSHAIFYLSLTNWKSIIIDTSYLEVICEKSTHIKPWLNSSLLNLKYAILLLWFIKSWSIQFRCLPYLPTWLTLFNIWL